VARFNVELLTRRSEPAAGVFEGLNFFFQPAEQGLNPGFAFGILGDALASTE
jgi:hypothetical protein